MELTKREKRKLRLEKLRHESRHAQQEFEQGQEQKQQFQEPKRSQFKYYMTAVSIVILLIVAYSAYSFTKPSPYDNFAKCLTEKGAVMYGAMDWCKYTQGQKAMFGKSFKYIDYHEFQDLPGIKKTPTWVINGTWQENAQSFDKLAALTNCKL